MHNLFKFSTVVHRTFSGNTLVNLKCLFLCTTWVYTLHLCRSFHDFNACFARRRVVVTALLSYWRINIENKSYVFRYFVIGKHLLNVQITWFPLGLENLEKRESIFQLGNFTQNTGGKKCWNLSASNSKIPANMVSNFK